MNSKNKACPIPCMGLFAKNIAINLGIVVAGTVGMFKPPVPDWALVGLKLKKVLNGTEI